MMELNNKTAQKEVITESLPSKIEALTTELAKTHLALWNEVDRRRKAEQKLSEMEEMHYRILEATDCGILIADRDGNTLKTNDCLQKITGYSAEELREKGLISLSPNSADRQELHRIFSSLDQVRDWEILLKRKNDTTCTVLLNINRTELNGQKMLIARVQDITAWKHSEKTLRESMEYHDQILNHIADPIFVQNRLHMIVIANDAFCSLAGKSRENIIGISGYRYMSREQAILLFEQDEAIFKTGQACVTEDNIVDGEGNPRTLITKKTLLTKKNGEKQIVGVIRDITEQKQLEAQMSSCRVWAARNWHPAWKQKEKALK